MSYVLHLQPGTANLKKRSLLQYFLFKQGPLTTTGCDHGAFVKTNGVYPFRGMVSRSACSVICLCTYCRLHCTLPYYHSIPHTNRSKASQWRFAALLYCLLMCCMSFQVAASQTSR